MCFCMCMKDFQVCFACIWKLQRAQGVLVWLCVCVCVCLTKSSCDTCLREPHNPSQNDGGPQTNQNQTSRQNSSTFRLCVIYGLCTHVASIWPFLFLDPVSLPLKHFLSSHSRSKGIMTEDAPQRTLSFLSLVRGEFNGCLVRITPEEKKSKDNDSALRLTRCGQNS